MSSTSEPQHFAGVLRSPGVAAFLSGRFLAAMGAWCERLAVGWLIWDRTGSTGLLGLAVFLRLAPAIALSVAGGVLADRHGAVRMLRIACAVNAALAAALMIAAGGLEIWAIMALTCALGAVQALAAAPIKSVVPQILARRDLAVAIPLSSATFNLAAFVGPAAAGVAIALAGVWSAFAISVAGNLIFAAVLRRWRDSDAVHAAPPSGWMTEVGAAIGHVRGDPVIGPVFALHLAAAFCLRPFIDLMPAYVGTAGPGGAAMLGIATSAFGGGAVAGAIWMAASARSGALTRRLLWATLAAVLCLGVLALIPAPLAALPVILAFGGAMVVRATATLTLIQLVVPPALRGRVAGLYSMAIRGGAAVGALAIGAVAEPLGLRAGLLVAAAICGLWLAVEWRRASAGSRDG